MLFEQMEPNERFRARREAARRRRRRRRARSPSALLLGGDRGRRARRALRDRRRRRPRGATPRAAEASRAAKPAVPVKQPRALPDEVRGVHVTMALASLDGKLDEYLKLVDDGLNTIELDVKDENGEIGFVPSAVPLATRSRRGAAVLQAARGRAAGPRARAST